MKKRKTVKIYSFVCKSCNSTEYYYYYWGFNDKRAKKTAYCVKCNAFFKVLKRNEKIKGKPVFVFHLGWGEKKPKDLKGVKK